MRRVVDRLLRRAPAPKEPYEPELTAAIERVVQPGWTCADVGAHVGNITETLVRLVGKRGRVVAFEAHPTNADHLRARFKRARVVEVVNAAVGDGTTDRVGLFAGRHDHSTEWNVLGHDVEGVPTRQVLEVPAVSLDAWFSPGQSLEFVKIDVEGAEGLDDEAWLSRSELVAAGYALSRPDGSRIDPDGARAYHVIARPE